MYRHHTSTAPRAHHEGTSKVLNGTRRVLQSTALSEFREYCAGLERVSGEDGIQRLYKTEDPFLSLQQRPATIARGAEGRLKCVRCWSVVIKAVRLTMNYQLQVN